MFRLASRLGSSKDEAALQLEMGVNVLSKSATAAALAKMNETKRQLTLFKTQCNVMPPVAMAVVAKSMLGGPANFSQISFDKMGAERVQKACRRNAQDIDKILPKMNNIIRYWSA